MTVEDGNKAVYFKKNLPSQVMAMGLVPSRAPVRYCLAVGDITGVHSKTALQFSIFHCFLTAAPALCHPSPILGRYKIVQDGTNDDSSHLIYFSESVFVSHPATIDFYPDFSPILCCSAGSGLLELACKSPYRILVKVCKSVFCTTRVLQDASSERSCRGEDEVFLLVNLVLVDTQQEMLGGVRTTNISSK